jgi:hypothetical protein
MAIKKSMNIILLLFFLGIVQSCQKSDANLEFPFINVKESIHQHIKRNIEKEIDIAGLTPFNWDTLYIFKPYTSVQAINDSLGFIWKEVDKTFINHTDGFNLLVFTIDRSVVKYIQWPRNEGDFLKLNHSKYSYDSAKFVLRNEIYGGQDWLFFYEK